jgi:hypothetical protein
LNFRASIAALLASAWLTGCCFTPVGEHQPDGGADSDAGHPTSDAGGTCVPSPPSDLKVVRSYPYGPYITLASADLNGDGVLDLLAEGMDVFLAQTDGTLAAPANHPSYDVGFSGIATGDLNGDGLKDAVATGAGDSEVVTVFMNSGGGTLAASATYLASEYVAGFGLGDVTGDGFPDLILGGASLTELLINDGKGGFGSPTYLPAGGGWFGGLLVADLNGDGLADIAIRDFATHLNVFLSLPDGGFGQSTYQTDFNGGGLAVLNRGSSGVPDLAVANYQLSAVSILRNQGNGHFTDGGLFPVATGSATWIVIGDFNGDCILDIATSGFGGCANPNGGVSVLYGNSSGGFDPFLPVQTIGSSPAGMALLGPTTHPRNLAVANRCSGGVSVLGSQVP